MIFFFLDKRVFEHNTEYNTKEALEKLKESIFSPKENEGSFLTLASSPLHAVTLHDAARLRAAIPDDAAFVSFCYPCASETLELREKLAEDLDRGCAISAP